MQLSDVSLCIFAVHAISLEGLANKVSQGLLALSDIDIQGLPFSHKHSKEMRKPIEYILNMVIRCELPSQGHMQYADDGESFLPIWQVCKYSIFTSGNSERSFTASDSFQDALCLVR